MGVLKTKDYSNLTMPLTICDTFTVSVRYMSNKALREFTQRVSRPWLNPETRQMEDKVDEQAWTKAAPGVYLDPTGCAGLTPAILRKIGYPADDDQPTDAEIPVTAEVLAELWTEAHQEKFAVPIMRFSREMLAAAEVGKKNGSMT